MALISVACHSTIENGRTWMTRKTLESLRDTVDWQKHRLFLIDNASCADAKALFEEAKNWLPFTLITNAENVGTARAVNMGWAMRKAEEGCVKMDDDMVIHQRGWLDVLEECTEAEPAIGIIAIKRPDLGQTPHAPVGDLMHTELVMLPHVPYKPWRIVEVTQEAIGSCCLFSSKLLDKVGFLYQPSVYSYDDCLMAVRCEMAGFISCFYPTIDCTHVDPGGDAYCQWKIDHARQQTNKYVQIVSEYRSGKRSIHHGQFGD